MAPESRVLMRVATLVVVLLAGTSPAWANVGVPLIDYLFPGFWMLLPAIMLLEWAMALFVLRKGAWIAAKVAVVANIFSTLVGIPIKAVLVTAMIQAVNQSPFTLTEESWRLLNPLQKFLIAVVGSAPFGVGWRSPLEFEVVLMAYWGLLLLPFLLLSVWTEWLVAKRLLAKGDRRLARRWAWLANLVSYAALFALISLLFTISAWWHGP